MKLTDDGLAEWRAQPVSELVRTAMGKILAAHKQNCMERAWAGNPWPEDERLGLLRTISMYEDIFEATADRFNEIMELDTEEDHGDT
jgi:hypothetical protein